MNMLSRFCHCVLTALLILSLFSCGYPHRGETELLIIMYHHLDSSGDGNVTVSEKTFESHLCRLEDAGYATVSFGDVINYVDNGYPLPDKPVCIVFDDGYESVYTLAFPILKKHSAKATVCLIGTHIGCDTYKDTGVSVIPHLSWEQLNIMSDSGLVELGSHTYDMHMYAPLESGEIREYAVPLPSEADDAFGTVFRADHRAMCAVFRQNLGYSPAVFAYPHGKIHDTTEEILKSSGVRVTLTTENGINILKAGDPSSLRLMYRYNMNEYSDINAIIDKSSENKEE